MRLINEELNYRLITDIDDQFENNPINSFSSGNSSMDNFFQNEAYLDHIELKANTTIVYKENTLLAYFTLKQDFLKTENPENKRHCLSIERLGVQVEYQEQGIGTAILKLIISLAEMLNYRYITLDSVWEYREFYFKRGFEPVIIEEYENPNETGLVYMFMDLYDDEKVQLLYDTP